MIRHEYALVLLTISLALPYGSGGCSSTPSQNCPPKVGYYLAPTEELDRVRKVTIVSLSAPKDNETVAEGMTSALFQTVQGRRLFQLDVIDSNDTAWREMDIDVQQPLTPAQYAALRKAYRCDAILLGTIQEFQPYPRMRMSMRLQLLDLRKGKLLWGIDHVWDTTDQATEYRIRSYFSGHETNQFAPIEWHLATVSPRAFEKFVAYEIAQTLPCKAPKECKGDASGIMYKVIDDAGDLLND